MGKFRVRIHVGDFIISTVEKAENRNEAIQHVFSRQNFTENKDIKITCEELKKSAFQEWNLSTPSKHRNAAVCEDRGYQLRHPLKGTH